MPMIRSLLRRIVRGPSPAAAPTAISDLVGMTTNV
jgi:hypothetical protein